jgi:D-beta-D-heptose 7-phosphate kinase/D-beta-D-heptose 1-phosphate adenosyltransferase
MKLAKKLGDQLIVIVDNDQNLIAKKGFVYYSLEWRIELLQDYNFIDQVIPNIDLSGCCAETLRMIRPNVFAKGGDRTANNMPQIEIDVCREIGCEIVYGVGEVVSSSTGRLLEILELLGRRTT